MPNRVFMRTFVHPYLQVCDVDATSFPAGLTLVLYDICINDMHFDNMQLPNACGMCIRTTARHTQSFTMASAASCDVRDVGQYNHQVEMH